ncbi:MAG: glutamine amidotransferase class-I [Variovorax sp.]|nr:glutamine amidotransferase class-I [Variovorax sp.]
MENVRPHPLVIVKLGDTFAHLSEARGDFEHWIADGLGATSLPVLVLDPRLGDTLPSPDTIAGAIVTGSHAMVSHREPWSEQTAQWLATLVAHGTPLLGICFGHQLLAHAMGGEAGDHPGGIEIGTVDVTLTEAARNDALMRGLPANFDAHAAHQQSALRLPDGAVRLATSAHEPNQAFRLGERAWGVQFHPEFDATTMRGYVDSMADDLSGKGVDVPALRERVKATATAAQLLGRFAHIAEEHDAGAARLR